MKRIFSLTIVFMFLCLFTQSNVIAADAKKTATDSTIAISNDIRERFQKVFNFRYKHPGFGVKKNTKVSYEKHQSITYKIEKTTGRTSVGSTSVTMWYDKKAKSYNLIDSEGQKVIVSATLETTADGELCIGTVLYASGLKKNTQALKLLDAYIDELEPRAGENSKLFYRDGREVVGDAYKYAKKVFTGEYWTEKWNSIGRTWRKFINEPNAKDNASK